MREDQHRSALIQGRKARVLLKGTALFRWIEEGQQKWIYESVTAVSDGGIRLVAEYQPVWMTDDEGLERRRRKMESQIGMCRGERLFDWNVDSGSAKNRLSNDFDGGE